MILHIFLYKPQKENKKSDMQNEFLKTFQLPLVHEQMCTVRVISNVVYLYKYIFYHLLSVMGTILGGQANLIFGIHLKNEILH